MAFDWSRYAVGGAQRPDSFSGLDPQFSSALANMFSAAPPEILQHLRVTSGYRSPQRQAELWDGALKKYGSPEAARKWVAPPGRSNHNHGHASDLKYLDPSALKWAHENAGRFGLAFPLSNENWHIELAGRRGVGSQVASQQASPPQESGTPAPPMGEPINVGSQQQGGIMGAFAPVSQQQQQPSFMAGVDQVKDGNYLDGVSQMFGSMSAGGGQQQAPQAPAMQLAPVQGPSGQQATALANYVQALLGKQVSNG
ncbi:D-alanyl-D-alanine carboxypeptidase family protein [Ochrobactrum sp. EDr1-4]|uniref:D-alanyl-D-alanine carboxypeptidase family protein n=1 Tax=Ochrobactrum sp. EDr1-4 TaxID=3368622 RepID=UPI003BA157EA